MAALSAQVPGALPSASSNSVGASMSLGSKAISVARSARLDPDGHVVALAERPALASGR
jgi:hypothetical protein